MFNRLSDLKYQRTPEEALGFYLVTALVLLVMFFALGPLMKFAGVLGHTHQQVRIVAGVVSCVFGMMYCGVLAFMIGLKKEMDAKFAIALTALAMVAAIPHGMIGLFVTAYMTTRPLYWPERKAKPAVKDAGFSKVQRQSPAAPKPQAATPTQQASAQSQPQETVVSQARRTPGRLRPDLSGDEPADMP